MRSVTLLLLAMVVALSVGSLPSLAKSINGGAGNDHLVGNVGKDTISGGGGKDRIFGKGARDRLSGDAGGDEVHGNEGPDSIFGGNGRDDLFGNEGNDFHNVFDEQPNDRVNCGPGNDTAITDIGLTGQQSDRFANCETIFLPIPICGEICPNRTDQQADLSELGREDLKRAVEDGLLKKTEG